MLCLYRSDGRARQWVRVIYVSLSLIVLFVLLEVRFRWDSHILESFSSSNTAQDATYGVAISPLPSPSSSAPRLNIELRPEEHATREPTTLILRWQITSAKQSPDGVEKLVYLINGQFPGPTIEARADDRLVIEVENALDEPTAIHWHGLQMRDANAMDGAVGVTQAPIAAGETFIYNFTIGPSEHGTMWYHAHDHVQRADGLYGGLVVHKPWPHNPKHGIGRPTTSEQLLLIGDWYHRAAEDVSTTYMSSGSFGNEPVPDSLLINGRGAYDCSMAVPARPVICASVQRPTLSLTTTGKTRLRVANTGSFAGIELDLLGFDMVLFEIDGGYQATAAEFAKTKQVIWPGQRADFYISRRSPAVKALKLSITLSHENFKYANPALSTVHEFAIQQDCPSENPHSRRHETREIPAETKLEKATIAHEVNETIVLYSKTLKLSHLANVPHGFINHTSWSPQTSPLISVARSEWNDHQLVPHIPYSESQPLWIDIVLNNLDEDSHSWHLHGYGFYVVASHSADFGWGSYNPYVDIEPPGGPLDLIDPPMRDTVYVPRRGYVVLRFRADNPGIWMFHCHMLWHQASGMALALEVGEQSS